MNRIVIASIAAGALALSSVSAYAGKKYTELKAKNARKDEVMAFEQRMTNLAKTLETAGNSDQVQAARNDVQGALQSAKSFVETGKGVDFAAIELMLDSASSKVSQYATAA